MRVVIGFCVAALLTASSVAAQTKIAIGYGPSTVWMPAFVAKDQGFFAKHGIDASLTLIPVGSNQPSALIADSIQVSGMNPTILLLADEGGADIQVIAGADEYTKTDANGGLMVRTGETIASLADFRGKRIAVPGLNSTFHVAMMTYFRLHGVDPRSIDYLEVPINQMNDALRNAQVDAAMPVEPFAGQILAAKSGTQFMPLPPPFPNPATVYSFWTMRKSYIAAHPDVVKGYRAALDEALAWMKQNLDAARRTQITYLKTPEAIAMKTTLAPWSTHISGAELQFWIDACKVLDLTKGSVGLSDILAR
jgi:NitT/TauT family transport system substrate-binding protein